VGISDEKLGGWLHEAAENRYRKAGSCVTALFLLPRAGDALVMLPMDDGFADEQEARALARRVGAVSAAVVGECWVGISTLAVQALTRLPWQDLPVPADQDPAERFEAVITTVVGVGRPVWRRVTRVERGAHGVTLRPVAVSDAAPRTDGLAGWLAAILPCAPGSGERPE